MNKELGYLVIAAGSSVLAAAPLNLHEFPLDPRLLPRTAGLGVLWTGWRLVLFLGARRRNRRWRRSPSWSVDAANLPLESVNHRLARRLYPRLPGKLAERVYPDKGIHPTGPRLPMVAAAHPGTGDLPARQRFSLAHRRRQARRLPGPARRRLQARTPAGTSVERARRPRAYRRHHAERQRRACWKSSSARPSGGRARSS